jgi:predicted nucleotidyltransferase
MTAPRTVSTDVDSAIQEMVRRLVARFHPERIILFGSHARGEAGPDSDVDLLVVLSGPLSKKEQTIEVRLALRGVGVAKDVFLATPEEVEAHKDLPGTLVYPAMREGKVLYERAA